MGFISMEKEKVRERFQEKEEETSQSFRGSTITKELEEEKGNIRQYNCRTCRKSFSLRSSLFKHLNEHITNSEFKEKTESKENPDDISELQSPEEKEEKKNYSNEAWHNSGRRGSRFQCPYCRYTRNTKSQLEKHMKEHEDEVDDSSFTCDECPYQNNSRGQLNSNMKTAHGIRFHETKDSPQCTQCLLEFKTKTELLDHLKEKHINYKPCDFYNGPNNENNCELDGECQFYHVKLKPGEQICYKCGKTFK